MLKKQFDQVSNLYKEWMAAKLNIQIRALCNKMIGLPDRSKPREA